MKNQNEIPEGFVVVTRQIITDNVYMGDEERIVWGEKANEQLSLPNDQRNPHWRNVKFKQTEKESVKEDDDDSNGVDIPRKRTRNV